MNLSICFIYLLKLISIFVYFRRMEGGDEDWMDIDEDERKQVQNEKYFSF